MLYESTGGETNSLLHRLNPKNGQILASVSIPGDYAEGIAVLDDRLFQLSWKSGVAREFSTTNLQLIRTHHYTGEGWGLAMSNGRLVSSDGSCRLRFWNSQFELLDVRYVTSNGVPLRWLNDLETVQNRMYVNKVASPFILELDWDTGRLRRLVDCRRLIELESPVGAHRILNGIAYDPTQCVFFVTGKQWRSIFVIRIPE